jgi:ATPase subunit of ABC transporter with duplicated ATPase domains
VCAQGAILAVSHDESFVNKVINAAVPGSEKEAKSGLDAVKGELWVLSKCRLQRFDGSFKEYKKMITKKVLAGKDF